MSELSERGAAAIEDAVDTLLEDIGNGRQYGFDEEAHEQNVEELVQARDELRALRTEDGHGGEP